MIREGASNSDGERVLARAVAERPRLFRCAELEIWAAARKVVSPSQLTNHILFFDPFFAATIQCQLAIKGQTV